MRAFDPRQAPAAGEFEVLHVPLAAPVTAGKLAPANSPYVLALIERAVAGCIDASFAAMVTAPVHKGAINDAGIPFTGHTEYLAALTSTPRVVMMLAGGGLRVASPPRTWRWPRWPVQLRATCWRRRCAYCARRCSSDSASPSRASWSPGSIRTAAKADTSAAKKSRSFPRCWSNCAWRACGGRTVAGRYAVHAAGARARRLRAGDVSRSGAAGAQICKLRQGRQRHLGLPLCAPRSIMARRWSWPARARPTRAACLRRLKWRWRWCMRPGLRPGLGEAHPRKRFGQHFLTDQR